MELNFNDIKKEILIKLNVIKNNDDEYLINFNLDKGKLLTLMNKTNNEIQNKKIKSIINKLNILEGDFEDKKKLINSIIKELDNF